MNTIETFAELSGKLFIDGSYQTSQSTEHFDVIEPATEDRIAQIADATDAEVDTAMDVALSAGRAWNEIDMRKVVRVWWRRAGSMDPVSIGPQ